VAGRRGKNEWTPGRRTYRNKRRRRIPVISERLTKDELIIRLRKINNRCKDDVIFLEAHADTLQEPPVELLEVIKKKRLAIATQILYIKELENKR
jgi:hypothetical protein